MIPIVNGLILLFTALWLGNCLQDLWLHTIPGPVLGMILMLGLLSLREREPEGLSTVALWFIKYLSFFFIPAAVGIWFLDAEIVAQWPAIFAATVPATIATQLLVAVLLQRLFKRPDKRQ